MTYTFEKYTGEAVLWNSIISAAKNTSFLTSLEWIQFQHDQGKMTDPILIKADGNVIGLLYLEISKRRIAKYAYAPHGPVLIESVDLELFLKDLASFGKQFIKEHGLSYFKIDPLIPAEQNSLFSKSGWKKSLSPGQAKDMWMIELGNDSEALLQSLKKDTRYYVRRAAKMGVEIREAKSETEVEKFVAVLNETKQRQGFDNFNDSYFVDQWRALNQNLSEKNSVPLTRVFFAEFEGKTIAGALINYHKDTLYYSHGGSTSDPELSKLAAPYLLHFEIMKDAIEKGLKYYSMWGVVPKGINHDWRSMSDFKMKFPGEIIPFVGPYEVHNPTIKYVLNLSYDYFFYKNVRY